MYELYLDPPDTPDACGHAGGLPIGVDAEGWPRRADRPMIHLLTVDLERLPLEGAPEGARGLSVFISGGCDLSEAQVGVGHDHAALVWSSGEAWARGPLLPPDGVREHPRNALLAEPIELELDEEPPGDISRAGGEPDLDTLPEGWPERSAFLMQLQAPFGPLRMNEGCLLIFQGSAHLHFEDPEDEARPPLWAQALEQSQRLVPDPELDPALSFERFGGLPRDPEIVAQWPHNEEGAPLSFLATLALPDCAAHVFYDPSDIELFSSSRPPFRLTLGPLPALRDVSSQPDTPEPAAEASPPEVTTATESTEPPAPEATSADAAPPADAEQTDPEAESAPPEGQATVPDVEVLTPPEGVTTLPEVALRRAPMPTGCARERAAGLSFVGPTPAWRDTDRPPASPFAPIRFQLAPPLLPPGLPEGTLYERPLEEDFAWQSASSDDGDHAALEVEAYDHTDYYTGEFDLNLPSLTDAGLAQMRSSMRLLTRVSRDPEPGAISRIGGLPPGVSEERWPRREGQPMTHVVTVDAEGLLSERFRAVSVFLSSAYEHDAYQPGSDHAAVLLSTEEDLAQEPLTKAPEGARVQATHALELNPVPTHFGASDLASVAYLGGAPIWLDPEAAAGGESFLFQLDEDTILMALSRGRLYVFEHTAWVQILPTA